MTVPMPTLDEILQSLTETAENHPFDETALGVEYADWCGTGTYGVYCTWRPSWYSRNDLEAAREQHIEHLVGEQAAAIAALLSGPAAD